MQMLACATPRCPHPAVDRGRCAMHRRTTTERGYGHAWQQVTAQVRAARCARCGSTHDLTVDHIVPMSRGGTHTITNLRTLCRTCHGLVGEQSNRRDGRGALGGRPQRSGLLDPRAAKNTLGGARP